MALLTACGDDQTAGPDQQDSVQVLEAMLATLGGRVALEEIQTLVMQGSGTRMHLGQIPATGAAEPNGTLSALIETIDFANGRAAFDYSMQTGGDFSQHRTEAYTTYKGQYLGWGTSAGRPNMVSSPNGIFSWATHNTPEFLLRRNPVTIALAAAASGMVQERMLNEQTYWYADARLGSESVGVYINRNDYRLHAFTALDTESMKGDTNATYYYNDWRQVAGVTLPFDLEIIKPDGVYASVHYTDMQVNSSAAMAIFDIPADAIEQAEQVVAASPEAWVALEWNEVADKVSHVVAWSHHSMVVEFPDYAVVVEAPYTEAQSQVLARMIEQRLEKPVRYVVPTHPHYDHTGGLRALVALGANVLTAQGHEAEILGIVESPHSNPPDALARAINEELEVGRVEVFSGITDITETGQQVLLYEVKGIPHVNPKVLAFVPSVGVLFQSDLFFGGPGEDATALNLVIERLNLDVQQIVGGHGGVLPYTALAEAVGSGD